MPDEATARERGIFDNVAQPYNWEVTPQEALLIFDALSALMDIFQETLQEGKMDDVVRGGITGSYLFAKMTRKRLRDVVPDLQEEVETR